MDDVDAKMGESAATLCVRVKGENDLGLPRYGFEKAGRSADGGRVWLLRSTILGDTALLDKQISALIDYVEEKQLGEILQNDAVIGVDIDCYWLSFLGHGGPLLRAETLARVANHQLDLSFDCYTVDTQ